MRARLAGAAGWALSAGLHAALLGGLAAARTRQPPRPELVSLEIVEAPPPPPAPSPPEPARPGAAPPLALRLPPRPPPGHAPAPDAGPPPPRAPVHVGVSLSATATAGAVAAPVGNTLYGQVPETAPEPAAVKPLPPGTVPPTEVDAPPVPLSLEVPPGEYPKEAREAGFEGDVRLRLLVDAEGRVREATVLQDPGKGLGAAAVPIAKRYYRFKPALRRGQPVATEIVLTVRFQLP